MCQLIDAELRRKQDIPEDNIFVFASRVCYKRTDVSRAIRLTQAEKNVLENVKLNDTKFRHAFAVFENRQDFPEKYNTSICEHLRHKKINKEVNSTKQ